MDIHIDNSLSPGRLILGMVRVPQVEDKKILRQYLFMDIFGNVSGIVSLCPQGVCTYGSPFEYRRIAEFIDNSLINEPDIDDDEVLVKTAKHALIRGTDVWFNRQCFYRHTSLSMLRSTKYPTVTTLNEDEVVVGVAVYDKQEDGFHIRMVK